jgi:predicted PhzF superfamily epimerase YddE/YHI9
VKQRQFQKAGRWVLLQQNDGMFTRLDGNAPRQGDAIHRPSRLGLRIDYTGIYVSGATIELGRGTIEHW